LKEELQFAFFFRRLKNDFHSFCKAHCLVWLKLDLLGCRHGILLFRKRKLNCASISKKKKAQLREHFKESSLSKQSAALQILMLTYLILFEHVEKHVETRNKKPQTRKKVEN
jgi:hypothetical protein